MQSFDLPQQDCGIKTYHLLTLFRFRALVTSSCFSLDWYTFILNITALYFWLNLSTPEGKGVCAYFKPALYISWC